MRFEFRSFRREFRLSPHIVTVAPILILFIVFAFLFINEFIQEIEGQKLIEFSVFLAKTATPLFHATP